mmetsp:Transcript_22510/g.44224  ORF Transcript_22510/g.44224 Transcript_22510/m.44224 type:complete len:222 (+) Transcript_22510:371-1036(+)
MLHKHGLNIARTGLHETRLNAVVVGAHELLLVDKGVKRKSSPEGQCEGLSECVKVALVVLLRESSDDSTLVKGSREVLLKTLSECLHWDSKKAVADKLSLGVLDVEGREVDELREVIKGDLDLALCDKGEDELESALSEAVGILNTAALLCTLEKDHATIHNMELLLLVRVDNLGSGLGEESDVLWRDLILLDSAGLFEAAALVDLGSESGLSRAGTVKEL